jgi:FHS family L-fucose permease-like MFS transporter
MAIIGGALAPLAMGFISDKTGSIQTAYWVPLVCFVVVAYFGFSGYRPSIAKQNDEEILSGTGPDRG